MILLLVKDSAPWLRTLERQLSPYGVSVVHYKNPLKALDNLEEIRPSILLYDLQDFPRHWKILAKFLREEYSKDELIFLLLSRTAAPLEEANKALFLGINGILRFEDNVDQLSQQIREVFLRYGTFEIETDETAHRVENQTPLAFLFQHPRRKHLVTGVLIKFDGQHGVFKPDFAHEIADLSEGETLSGGSLRTPDRLIELNAQVIRNNGQLQLAVQEVRGVTS